MLSAGWLPYRSAIASTSRRECSRYTAELGENA